MTTEATTQTTGTGKAKGKEKVKPNALLKSNNKKDIVRGLIHKLADATRNHIRENSPQTDEGKAEAQKRSKGITNTLSAISQRFAATDFTSEADAKQLADVLGILRPVAEIVILPGASYAGQAQIEAIREALGAKIERAESKEDWKSITDNVLTALWGDTTAGEETPAEAPAEKMETGPAAKADNKKAKKK